jgi:hypothetical protein
MKRIIITTLFLFLFPVLMLLGGCSSPSGHLALSGQFYVAKDKAGYYVKVDADGNQTEYAVTKYMPLDSANYICKELNNDVGPDWYYLENP